METENRKYTILSFIVFSAICAYVLYLVLSLLADSFRFGGSNVFSTGLAWPVVGGSTASLGGLILFVALALNAKATEFIDDCFAEIKKVTWPTGKATAASTVVVTVLVLIAALLFLFMDFIWGTFFKWIL